MPDRLGDMKRVQIIKFIVSMVLAVVFMVGIQLIFRTQIDGLGVWGRGAASGAIWAVCFLVAVVLVEKLLGAK